ncbi:homoserine dehydrogenase-domain-containing protein [Endogone sp. FLAS-F59071]|nr:homoserine dehydrogenase-domain-containing protein [Endogone sp. FLAS-F59071]|eukprot:RUS21950.1 homoserine dehydrogenase-domain-containing protein [Endogone sp. FLAS-F59071]
MARLSPSIHLFLHDNNMVNIAIVGLGLVGSELFAQLHATKNHALRVVALTNSRRMLLSDALYTALPSAAVAALAASETSTSLSQLTDYLAASPSPAVVVDCTSSSDVAALYPSWLRAGISIVTPNKKAFSSDLTLYNEIRSLSSSLKGPFVYHESTVGAGLPVLSTLSDLVKTGDKVVKVEGIFSGTMSYIFNNFSTLSEAGEKKRFSEIVAVAKELGYTEPDPRDDLNGMDVARKVVIAGRLIGVPLTLSTLAVENVVPVALRDVHTSQEFLSRLPEHDDHFGSLNAEAAGAGEVLRYVGVVDTLQPDQSGARFVRYPAAHPFASLRGSDNVIKITTERFPNGLIIQGAGAGAAVTAFGVFADLLKVQERVGGL